MISPSDDSDNNISNLLGNILLPLRYQNKYDKEFIEVK